MRSGAMFAETIGLGMLMSFFMSETIGLAAGGIVVPGYIALSLNSPFRVAATIGVALAVYLVLRILANWMLLYGRRLLVLGILLGYLIGSVTKLAPPLHLGRAQIDLATIGYVIPGLIAYWMERQGVIQTIATMLVAGVLTRLVVTVISGGEMQL
ncbi:MAG: poly-gamma-glutamate biosynthesis protein PgsC [candidate division WOR-3 bacterium]